MKITTSETHHRSHFIKLSKQEVENIVRDAVYKHEPGIAKRALFVFDWTDDTVDSGLRKVPQITVRITEDLSPPDAAVGVTAA